MKRHWGSKKAMCGNGRNSFDTSHSILYSLRTTNITIFNMSCKLKPNDI